MSENVLQVIFHSSLICILNLPALKLKPFDPPHSLSNILTLTLSLAFISMFNCISLLFQPLLQANTSISLLPPSSSPLSLFTSTTSNDVKRSTSTLSSSSSSKYENDSKSKANRNFLENQFLPANDLSVEKRLDIIGEHSERRRNAEQFARNEEENEKEPKQKTTCFEDSEQEQRSGFDPNEMDQECSQGCYDLESSFTLLRDVTSANVGLATQSDNDQGCGEEQIDDDIDEDNEVTFNFIARAEKVTSLLPAPVSVKEGVPLKGPARFLNSLSFETMLQNLRLSANSKVLYDRGHELKQEPKALVKILPRNIVPTTCKTVFLKPFPKPKTVCALAILYFSFRLFTFNNLSCSAFKL